ncbi:hypothetical protein [Amycolatopsis suaedae]|uniref:DUF2637 domain-containing protein n=1 Tax=Amycolatopsis suaedae TaxID=2510978 RepID=A0A4Q7JAC3_9PSEU|nr:hypothetical protein [Amycolatopsis suaedae]RZQ64207.1 hypothetical protein EWH70_09485 [Amycolatopsis suaedae]
MNSTATDAKHVPLSTADKLRQDADEAAAVRALANHPDVIALRVEKVRRQVNAAIWAGILLGLAFTMVNVQQFAAEGAPPWSLAWVSAWLLDPMVSVVLVAVLLAEQVTSRYQVMDLGGWVHATKWFAFLATYVMNTWKSWTVLDAAGIVLHSIPPALVFLASETAPMLRDRLTEAVTRAAHPAFTGQAGPMAADTVPAPAPVAVPEVDAEITMPIPAVPAAPADRPDQADRPARKTGQKVGQKGGPRRKAKAAKSAGKPRKLANDYVAEARAAWAPGIEITPAWVRSVTDCARGTSSTVAARLRDELATGTTVTGPTPVDGIEQREAA